ncbi:E3 ubiquitin-protein ligase TRAIP isoform X1 [Bicyclus anynana]|uniref:E3 ubiquitin-protein ligase TRAIP isoform X1 n=1 Tax=Bicyclus anynana TaxID=110368 RepID=A0A6J1MJJ6_BICAN|nr:E3 ubiquitin-protein ligase TRAIP isoform X1 [Bicyclus anynana]
MHILCSICSDLLNQAENIYVTKCGHMFHYQCLSQWIERSRTCPQCRNKVTERCMYRLFPNVSNEAGGEDVATLQSRLDDVLLKLRQHRASCKEHEDKAAETEAQLNKNVAIVKSLEKQLAQRETAFSALKEQLEYLKIQNSETQKLKEENENLKKNMQTLNGLQKVLNATSAEVEEMLEGYTDVKTVATFATALKRALCESENKKNDTRDRLQAVKQKLAAEKSIVADLQSKLALADDRLTTICRKYKALKHKRKSDALEVPCAPDSPSTSKRLKRDPDPLVDLTDNNNSFNTMVVNIENSDSPYLRLQQSSLALSTLTLATQPANPAKSLPDKNLKPSEYAVLNSARNIQNSKPSQSKSTSIFQKKDPTKISLSQENDPNLSLMNISYNGLGGHSKLDTFPTPKQPEPKTRIPRLTAKHKLKRPVQTASSNQDIRKMLQNID